MPRRRRPLGARVGTLVRVLVVGLVGGLALAGCAAIPTSGPVSTGAPVPPPERGLRFQPVSPPDGAAPLDVVRGFLLAASGVEDDHAFARAYLVPQAARSWRPGAGITVMVDGSAQATLEQGGAVLAEDARPAPDEPVTATVSYEVAARVDANGRLTVAAPGTQDEVGYRLEQTSGQWRIADLPDGLVVDEAGFDLAFTPHQLYWVDATGGYLVPETRWFAERRAIATSIVTELLRGPSPWLAPAVSTGFPPGTALTRPPAVPVVGGEARVDLTRAALDAGSQERALMQAQLQATLRPVPAVATVRVTVEGGEFVLPDSLPALVRDPGAESVAVAASPDGLVEARGGTVRPVEDLPVTEGLTLTDPARSTAAYAALDADRTRLLYLVPGTAEPEELLTGTDLLAPSIDPHGWVWTTPRVSTGLLPVARPGGEVVEVSAPWLSGRRVSSLRVARDGARVLLATVDPSGAHRVELASVERTGDGRPLSLTRASGASLDPTLVAVSEVAWTGEASAAVLGRRAGEDADRVYLADPLGAPTEPLVPLPEDVPVVSLAAGSTPRAVVIGSADGRLWQRAGAQWVPVPADVPLSDPAFAG